MTPDFPLRAGWEAPGPEDQLGHSESVGTPVWPGRPCEPRTGWSGDAREVFVQGSDALPARYRRRHVLRYPDARQAQRAFTELTDAVSGHPLVETVDAGVRWYVAASTTRRPDGDQLAVLRWSRDPGGQPGGSSAFHAVREGCAVLLSVDAGPDGGHQGAAARAEADLRGLAPALAALRRLGRAG